MLQPKKKIFVKVSKKVPVERVIKIADSLKKVGNEKIENATNYLKYNTGYNGDESNSSAIESGYKDISNAKRYKVLVDKAKKTK